MPSNCEESHNVNEITNETSHNDEDGPLLIPLDNSLKESQGKIVYPSISSIKDKTSDNENNYSMMRKIFNSYNNNNRQNKFNDSSSYIQNKKMIATGRQRLNNNVAFFTNNNHLEIKQAKRLLRSRGSGIPKKNIQ